jgi:hypothetical protein
MSLDFPLCAEACKGPLARSAIRAPKLKPLGAKAMCVVLHLPIATETPDSTRKALGSLFIRLKSYETLLDYSRLCPWRLSVKQEPKESMNGRAEFEAKYSTETNQKLLLQICAVAAVKVKRT